MLSVFVVELNQKGVEKWYITVANILPKPTKMNRRDEYGDTWTRTMSTKQTTDDDDDNYDADVDEDYQPAEDDDDTDGHGNPAFRREMVWISSDEEEDEIWKKQIELVPLIDLFFWMWSQEKMSAK